VETRDGLRLDHERPAGVCASADVNDETPEPVLEMSGTRRPLGPGRAEHGMLPGVVATAEGDDETGVEVRDIGRTAPGDVVPVDRTLPAEETYGAAHGARPLS